MLKICDQILANESDYYKRVVFIENQPADHTKVILSGVLPNLTEDDIQYTVICGTCVMMNSMPKDTNPVETGATRTVKKF